MSVLSHLTRRSSEARLSGAETEAISRSIVALQGRVNTFFGGQVSAHFQFGSSTRGTILPRAMDPDSDVDYMVVFADATYKPQTYLDRLRRFVERYYQQSEVVQSNPTIVLNLNHIRFELVPAINTFYGGLQIPAPATSYQEWMSTDPLGFTRQLNEANVRHGNLLKPTIRLMKYWNARNGYVYGSFLLEKALAAVPYWGAVNQRDYFYAAVESLYAGNFRTQWRADKVAQAQKVIQSARANESWGYHELAEADVRRLVP